ncbi:Ig-like domain (group 3) [Georgenia satyanarayanai]|uniref:Ig-like domain (Group 3) n=1 Tax=Georgenia satyanarayanai TaxID=860221 RepID=A0A2Y9ARS2_9MICO|nr:Ig-like domain repeat protein [Georgenia satyanarayanai]PYF98322.1 Ig-like domain-containing protein [Georgenia satyanarayanai]SSA45207.1 Ig-like domain (group 3) [Georgenia satyanarayanai]
MAVLMSLAGNTAGDGFLIAPLGSTYPAELLLWTDAGSLAVTVQASPNAAGLVFSQTSLTLTTTPSSVMVHSTLQSGARGDTTIQVLDGAAVVASFAVTSLNSPVVHFRGRFEARFATDNAAYNRNPMYTATNDAAVPPGWTWALEGEPGFVPPVGNVPENLETPVGRVVRLNNPEVLRSHAQPVTTAVDAVVGTTTAGPERFTRGDPLIGDPVDLGPDTYLAGNNPQHPADPQPEEIWAATIEPMALFELHLGSRLSGRSSLGPFTAKATTINQHTRTPDDRPIANGLVGASLDLAAIGLPDLPTWSATRIDQLLADYTALPAGDSVDRRNLKRRIGHLLAAVTPAKRTAVQAAHPGEFSVRAVTLPGGWSGKEVYDGKVNADLTFTPDGSAVVEYLSGHTSLNFQWTPFAFHSDELLGHHWGLLGAGSLLHGAYTGDPHTTTVDGTRYDFQSVGEFTLLRGDGLEVQVRQTPVNAANPVTDGHSGLTVCVSIITAVALRVGRHTVSYQPTREGKRLQLFVDGKPRDLPPHGLDLERHRLSVFDAAGEEGLRVDYATGAVVTVTPAFWGSYSVWYLNVAVSGTAAHEGVMGYIPDKSWLPRLRDGTDLGPLPSDLHGRYKILYRIFADSWRVEDHSSMFVYEQDTSTDTFTDRDWPGERPPCDAIKPELAPPGLHLLEGMDLEKAEMVCRVVTEPDLHANCVFDVATTGDEEFARGYVAAQELRLYGTKVDIAGFEAPVFGDRMPPDGPPEKVRPPAGALAVTARVSALVPGRPVPTGSVTFVVDDVPLRRPLELDGGGRVRTTLRLKPGRHVIRAFYSGGGKYEYHSSTSPNLRHSVKERTDERPPEKEERPGKERPAAAPTDER